MLTLMLMTAHFRRAESDAWFRFPDRGQGLVLDARGWGIIASSAPSAPDVLRTGGQPPSPSQRPIEIEPAALAKRIPVNAFLRLERLSDPAT
jgi:hypothetical protein